MLLFPADASLDLTVVASVRDLPLHSNCNIVIQVSNYHDVNDFCLINSEQIVNKNAAFKVTNSEKKVRADLSDHHK